MEVADGKGNVKEVHKLTGVLQGKWKRGSTNIAKDKDGKILTTEEERLAVFKAFYEVKFASAPSISSDIVPTLIDILPGRDEPPKINLLAPTLKEVEMAAKCLSNEKSTGIDEVVGIVSYLCCVWNLACFALLLAKLRCNYYT